MRQVQQAAEGLLMHYEQMTEGLFGGEEPVG
jgi:hypothetical protein